MRWEGEDKGKVSDDEWGKREREGKELTLMPAFHNSAQTFILSSNNPSPKLMTYTSVALPLLASSPLSLACFNNNENNLSTPNEMPTHGILPAAEVLPENMPTKSS